MMFIVGGKQGLANFFASQAMPYDFVDIDVASGFNPIIVAVILVNYFSGNDL